MGIQIKKVNPDGIQLVFQLEGSTEIIVKENTDSVTKMFRLTVAVGRDRAVLSRQGEFFDEPSVLKSKS